MGFAENLSGLRFGKLVAIKLVGHDRHGFRLWLWRCDCGEEIARVSAPIKQGRQISCGCYKNEQSRQRAKHGQSQTRTYRAWIAMKARCKGRDERDRRYYVRRGITVHPKWKESFEAFFTDMGECPPGLTLERIKNHLGYAPENCRWASQGDQCRNTNRTIRVFAPWRNSFGVVTEREVCLKDACASSGINYNRVRSRIRAGKPPQIAFEMG